jgi:sugar phosphate isomerase/epimerase
MIDERVINVYLGLLTVCLGNKTLREKAEWARENGFESLEVACWPENTDRDYAASDIDVSNLTRQEADAIKGFLKQSGLTISALAYYDNNLDRDPDKRAFVNGHLKRCIDAAALLDAPLVGTFAGRNIDRSVQANFDEFEKVFGGIVRYAEQRNIKLMIENCPMEGWQAPGLPGTISFAPDLWQEMFRRIPSRNLGLNLDPSHLVLQLMDYIGVIPEFKDRIFHVHAKDVKVYPDKLKRYGIFNRQLFTGADGEFGYRKPCIPGLGDVDWELFLRTLRVNGYDGVISIEHEDPDYEGSEEKVHAGLMIAKKHLEKYI